MCFPVSAPTSPRSSFPSSGDAAPGSRLLARHPAARRLCCRAARASPHVVSVSSSSCDPVQNLLRLGRVACLGVPPALKPSLSLRRVGGVSPGWEWAAGSRPGPPGARGPGLGSVLERRSQCQAQLFRSHPGPAVLQDRPLLGSGAEGCLCPLGVSGQACLAGAWPVSWKVLLCPVAKEPGLPPDGRLCVRSLWPHWGLQRGICWERRFGSQAGGRASAATAQARGWLLAVLGGGASGGCPGSC